MAAKTRGRRNGARQPTPAQEKAREERAQRGADLKAQLEEFMAELEIEADEAGIDVEELIARKLRGREYAEKYNGLNPLRIYMQAPRATDVRGYFDWQDAGRQPRFADGGITIVQPVGKGGKDDGETAPADGPAEAAPAQGAQPGEISSKDLKAKRQFFALKTVYDVTTTDPITCETCGEQIHRTGRETTEQMEARNGRKRAALWTHTSTKPADGHKAVKPWKPAEAAPAPAEAALAAAG